MLNSLNHITSCLCISYQLSVDVLGVEDSQKIESVKCIGLKRINARRERNITLRDIHKVKAKRCYDPNKMRWEVLS